MVPQATIPPAAASAARSQLLKSPVFYVFGGIALLLAIIAVSLFVLACLNLKRRRQRRLPSFDQEKQVPRVALSVCQNQEDRIVVIMAGENRPTCIAVPAKNMVS